MEKISDKAVAALLRSGDKDAFELVFDKYAPAIFGFINRMLADKEASELILQKTFFSAWEKKETLKTESIFAWLIQIARNLSLNHLGVLVNNKKTKIHNADSFVDIGKEEKNRSALYLLYYKGLTLNEAANELGTTIKILKTMIRTELKQLRGVTSE
ncbi:MAG: hypothetical protein IAF38_13100 [Bacteroidia bacterium]|nr:hypothetical protein [Bacteroidia bacterium]